MVANGFAPGRIFNEMVRDLEEAVIQDVVGRVIVLRVLRVLRVVVVVG
jgi:hypothetical protein